MGGDHRAGRRALNAALAAAAVVVGLGMVALAVAVGDCAAFGGACPSEPPPLPEDDAFGMAAAGAFLATAVPLAAFGRPVRRWTRALAVGAGAALVVGLIARSATAS